MNDVVEALQKLHLIESRIEDRFWNGGRGGKDRVSESAIWIEQIGGLLFVGLHETIVLPNVRDLCLMGKSKFKPEIFSFELGSGYSFCLTI